MRAKITQHLAEGLAPRARIYSVYDTEVAGFQLRVQPSGAKSWYLSYRNEAGGRRTYRLGGFPGLAVEGARRLARQAAGKVAAEIDVQAERQAARAAAEVAKVSSLGSFIEKRYAPWAATHLRHGELAARRLRADFSQWLEEPLSSFNTWRLESWRKDRLKAGAKRTTINRQLVTLRAALSKALEWGVLSVHPLATLKPLKVTDDKRTRYLAPDEERRLREALLRREANLRGARDRFNVWRAERGKPALPARARTYVDHLQPMVLLTINVGLRRGELFQLRWGDIDLEHSMLTVRAATSKGGTGRHIPLNTEALEVLKTWERRTRPRAADVLVFPGEDGKPLTNIDKAWRTVTELAKLENLRFHDLRHTFASKLVRAGVDLNRVRTLLGHADIKMSLRYAHLAPDDLAQAVAKIG